MLHQGRALTHALTAPISLTLQTLASKLVGDSQGARDHDT
jgi:hypothetical protein